jgi:chromate transporter
MAVSAKITWATAIIPIAGALLIWLGGLSPVWIIFVTVVATLLYTYLKEKKNLTAKQSDSEQHERSNSKTI